MNEHKCYYCGKEANYQFKNGKWCCSQNMNGCPAIKELRKKASLKQWKETKNLGFSKLNENIKENTFTPNICAYCGEYAEYQLKSGKWCCSKSYNSCPEARRKNSCGLKKAYNEGRIDAREIYKNKSEDAKKRQAWSNGKCLKNIKDVFCKNSNTGRALLKRYILKNKLMETKCAICGIDIWNGKEISLQLHHIDGDKTNNLIENLQLLCPNCHSQTDNFCGKNDLNFSLENISIKKIKEGVEKVDDISSLLIFLGCRSTGKAICEKIKKVMEKYNIHFKTK